MEGDQMRIKIIFCTIVLTIFLLSRVALVMAETLADTAEVENRHLLTVGMSKEDTAARSIFENICIGFEALHPKNVCQEQYLANTDEVLQALKVQKIDLAMLPEEVALENSTFVEVLLPIYQKSFTLIVHLNTDVQRLSDLQQKKIGFVKNNDDNFKPTELFLSRLGVKGQENWIFYESNEKLVSQFCDHHIDAILMMITHPDRVVRELTTACDGTILPISARSIDKMVKDIPAYGHYEIMPAYWHMTKSIPTVSTRVLLLTNGKLPADFLDDVMTGFWNEIKENKSFLGLIGEINTAYNQGKLTLAPSGMGIISKIRAIKGDFSNKGN